MGAGARFLVDQAYPRGSEPGEGGGDIGDAIGNMVQSRTAAREEPAHGRFGGKWFDEFDATGPLADEYDVDSLVRYMFDWRGGATSQEFEEGTRFSDRRDRDSQMIEGQLSDVFHWGRWAGLLQMPGILGNLTYSPRRRYLAASNREG